MKFFSLFLFSLFISFISFAQKPATISKAAIDSIEELKMLLDVLDRVDKPTSNFDVSLGIGNKLFSVKNNTINASQAQVKKIYFTPSIAYHHKTGFGLSITPYITSDSGKFKVYQTALTPSYDFTNDNISFGVSYTRYLADYNAYNSNSTYQNDFYASFKYLKTYIQPLINIGIAGGKFKEITPIPYTTLLGVQRIFQDSTDNKIRDFSLSLGIEHSFDADSIFNGVATFTFTPQLMLNAGNEKFTTTHTNKNLINLASLNTKKSKKLKSSLTQNGSEKFAIQSLSLSLDFLLRVKSFTISPNVFLDYNLKNTTEDKLSNVFSITFGYSF